jgi:4-carboxymuconolactone decarboxylase
MGLPDNAGVDAMVTAMVGRLGAISELGYSWIFGDIWARPVLQRRERSIVVVAILTAQGAQREMHTHVAGAIRHGLTRTEVEEVILCSAFYAGFPHAVEALYLAREVFAGVDSD